MCFTQERQGFHMVSNVLRLGARTLPQLPYYVLPHTPRFATFCNDTDCGKMRHFRWPRLS